MSFEVPEQQFTINLMYQIQTPMSQFRNVFDDELQNVFEQFESVKSCLAKHGLYDFVDFTNGTTGDIP
jgi:hypothetical protein